MNSMNGLLYFPGCSLKQEAQEFEQAGLAVMQVLGLPMTELDRWNCCGTVFSLTSDDLMHQIGPVRNLIRAQEAGGSELVTLCSMCFNTLKRAQLFVEDGPDHLTALNAFMDEEQDYQGQVVVKHLLEVLRDTLGWEQVGAKVERPLSGVRIASYYGCTLLRPTEIAIDDRENPTILQSLVEALGAEVCPLPFQSECCGSFQVTDQRPIVLERAYRILDQAKRGGADLVMTSCPLCFYNLEDTQAELGRVFAEFKPIPVLYFTQVLAYALGIDVDPVTAEQLSLIREEPLEQVR